MAKITGVTFKEGGKVYYFSPGKDKYKDGMGVIVETTRGTEYATVVMPYAEVDEEKLSAPLKPILRVATPKDKETHRKNLEKRQEALKTVAEKIKKHYLWVRRRRRKAPERPIRPSKTRGTAHPRSRPDSAARR